MNERTWRQRIFAASWLSYFSYYFTRNSLKATKTTLKAEFHLSKSDLNWIDTAYNVAYCLGQVTNGFIVDRIGPRRWVSLGMLASAALVVVFQQVHTVTGMILGAYMVVWGVHGFAQSTGWPGNGKLMATWYGTARRGEVMGWWSTCYQAGGLVAVLLLARLLGWFGWRAVFIGPAIWVAVVGIAFYVLVRDRPSDVGFEDPDTGGTTREEQRALLRAEWPRVLRTPMVWAMGAAYFCCKLIRYAFLFWLPYYLETILHYSKESSLDTSISFEAGGIVFVIVAGMLADRVFQKRRVLTALVFLVMLVGALFFYQAVSDRSHGLNVLALVLVGGCLFAADSLISGAVAQDLGGPHAAALAAGLINGLGSIGQVLQGFLLVWLTDDSTGNWDTLFYLFAVLAGVGALCCLPFVRVGPKPSPTA